MTIQKKNDLYEKGLHLAESGQHPEALECIQQYLSDHPEDIEVLNDTAAILFCMERTDEAIEYLSKANDLDADCPEVRWNLVEACLSSGRPKEASRHFAAMESMNILNVDTLNRTANQFIQNENYQDAVDTLQWSLKMIPDQEILKPMIEIVQSKMPSV